MPTQIDSDTAANIVNAIFDELSGRAGIGNEIGLIHGDNDVYEEMYESCVTRARVGAACKNKPTESHWSPRKKED